MRRTAKSLLRLEELERRDVPTATVSVFGSRDGSEGENDASFTLFRDQTAGALTVQYTLTTTPLGQLGTIGPGGGPNPPPPGGGGGPTNSPVPGSVTFADGEEFADVVIAVPDTNLREWDREVALSLTASFGYLVSQSGPDTLLIHEDEPQGDFFVDSTRDALEGVSAGYVRLRRWDASAAQTVSYSLNAASTAVSGVDFAPVSGSLTFAVGQATADVVIDPTGPYDDPADEADVFVGIDFTTPGGDFVSSQAVEVADERPANNPPSFTLPQNQMGYSFLLGERSAKDTYVGKVIATDPDAGDKVSFEITVGNADEFFKINKVNGWIQVAKDLTDATPLASTLTVKAKDNRGGSATVSVVVSLKPLVLISGDVHGVEAPVGTKRDKIQLDFHRLTRDASAAVTVKYTVAWGSAQPADLDNPGDLVAQGQTEGQITFAANQTLKSIILTPTQDNTKEDLETFTVTVVSDSPNYITLQEDDYVVMKTVKEAVKGEREATVSILDAVTLFAKSNATAALADPADGNGVNLNDAMQGRIPDCFFIAGIGSMAQRTPAVIESLMTVNNDGTVTVDYYPTVGGAKKSVKVDMTLDWGVTQAKLSKDYADSGNSRAYEIWPQILEKAYAQIIGWNKLVGGDRSAYEVWRHFTGQTTEAHLIAQMQAAALQTALQTAVTDGKKVVLSSWWKEEEGERAVTGAGTAGPIYKNHAYILQDIQNGIAILSNPWGSSHARVRLADLKTYFERYQIQ